MEANRSDVDMDMYTVSTNTEQYATETTVKGRAQDGIFRGGGTLPTGICLSKAAIGAGVLSMAAHTANVGLMYMLVALAVGGVLNVISIRMIAEAGIATNRWSFEDICEELFHPIISVVTGFINMSGCLGSGAAYLIICGQIFQVLSGADEAWRQRFIVLTGTFVCMPLALAEHVSFMRHLASLSIFGLLLLIMTVVRHLWQWGPDDSITARTLWCGPSGATMFFYMNSLNNIIFAYNNSANVPQLTGEITPEPSAGRMAWAAWLATGLCFLLYAFVALFGLLAFGVGSNQKDTLVLDMLSQSKDIMVFLSLAAVMFSVLTCFQFHVYPIRQFTGYLARRARGRGAGDEATDIAVGGRSLTRWLDITFSLATVGSPWSSRA